LATEEGTKLAQETTRSAREIRMVLQQYQAGTEQVSAAMNDISQVGQQSAVSSRQVLAGSKDLAVLSERLLSTIERFRFDDDSRAKA
jgi:methyl-accepting chemotaxis protein